MPQLYKDNCHPDFKPPKKVVPSLAVNPDEKVNLQDYHARKLCDGVSKQNPHAMRMLKKGLIINVGDESTVIGSSTIADGTASRPDEAQSEYSDQQVRRSKRTRGRF